MRPSRVKCWRGPGLLGYNGSPCMLMSAPARDGFLRKLKAASTARASVLRLDGYVHGQHVLRHALAVREQLQAISAVVLQPRGVRCITALLRAWNTLPWLFTDDVRTLDFFSTFNPAVCSWILNFFAALCNRSRSQRFLAVVLWGYQTNPPASCSAVKQPFVRL